MGVDITTYRCRVGSFVSQRGAGLMQMPVFIDFSKLVKMIGVLIFIKLLLFRAGIEQNPGPTTPPKIDTKVEDQTVPIGKLLELNVPISGDGPFTVKVMKGGTELIGKDHIEIKHSADCVTVKVNKLVKEDSGSYRIDVSNVIGTDTCSFEMKVVGKYNFRYQYLLVEIGTKVLRKLFDCKVGNDFGQYLASHTAASGTLTSLMTGRNPMIKGPQQKLLPPTKAKPVSSDFDITLLYCLLRNVCGLRPPNNSAWMNPMFTDTSVEALITRLKDCRNNLSHNGTVLFSETDLRAKWTELSDILSELNKHCGKDGISDISASIDAARHMDIDEEMQNHFTNTVKRWYENDKEVKTEVMKLGEKMTAMAEDVSKIKRQLEDEKQTGCKRVKGNEEKSNVDDGSDIREKLIRIYEEDCSTLSVSPLFEDETSELLKIYQNPTMFRVNYNKELKKENSKREHQVEQTKEDKKVITSYQGIFGKEDLMCKNIYITGDAGVGKTSFCKRMCLLWCKSKLNDQIEGKCDDKASDRIKADVQYMSRFDFVFYVTLRDTDLIDVNAMIVEQLFYTHSAKGRDETYVRITNILMNKDCLVILDGYDEWMPKTTGKKKCYKPSCINAEHRVLLTTCRPFKINDVRLSPTEIDQQVQITGIDSNSSKNYIEYLVKNMNEANDDIKDPNKFKRDVRKCNLQELLCIPMIASHLVVLWFDRKLTEMSLAHIYSHILDMLFERAAKRQVDFPQSTGGEYQLPDSLAEFTYLQQHAPLLYKLCLLSFKSFINKDEVASTLVFSEQQLMSEPYKLSNEESFFLCQIGILSKNKMIGRYLKQKQKISFIHKSYIEFLAAFFVSSFDKNNSFEDSFNKWTCVYDVVQYKNFFLFLTGFSYQKMNISLEKVYQSMSDHLHLCRKNSIFHYDDYYYLKQIRSLQNMIVNCFKEVRKYNQQDCRLLIEDFILDNSYYDNVVTVLKQLLLLNTTCIKAIHSRRYYPEFDQIHCLQYLITDEVSSADFVKFTECMLRNKSTLHTVCIKGDGFDFDKTLIPELPVRSLHHLTSLSLSDVYMEHNSLHNLVIFLSDNVLIENVKLCDVFCDHQYEYTDMDVWDGDSDCTDDDSDCFDDDSDCIFTLNLPQHTRLTSLCLEKVNILCNNVNNSSLQSIKLAPESERIVRLCYFDVFKCIKDSQLEHLYMHDDSMLDNNTMKTLTSTVKTLPCIKSLILENMELPDDVLIQLHPHVTQVMIELFNVTVSCQWFHCFIESCVNNKSLIKVKLEWCKITSVDGETHSVLSEKESVKYMYKYLKSKSTVNITYKYDKKLYFEKTSCQ